MRRDNSLAIQDLAAGELFDFTDGIQHATRDIFERRFNRRRRFPAHDEPIFLAALLNENRLRRRRTTVGRENAVDVRCSFRQQIFLFIL